MPIYGSVDIRDFGWKVGVVDANHFPAGFNNISKKIDLRLVELLKTLLKQHPNCTWIPVSRVTSRNALMLKMSDSKLLLGCPVQMYVGSPPMERILNG